MHQDLPIDYSPPPRSKKPRKWPAVTPELHERIKRLYRSKIDYSGEVREFAQRCGLPRWKITRYALEQGWSAKQRKMPAWTEAELTILERSAHHCPQVIQRRLKKAGFERSLVSIVLKRKRMRFIANIPGQSAQALAVCLGEDVHFVLRAIRNGQLKAQRRQTNRTARQGGDTYLIRDKDVRSFVLNHLHMIDLRKVDKYWFVDLLANAETQRD